MHLAPAAPTSALPTALSPALSSALRSALLAGVLALAAACGPQGEGQVADAARPGVAPSATAGGRPALPAGWRWEGFAGVVVGVPADFGWGNGTQVLSQWCVDESGSGDPEPIVGRPGATTLVGCSPAEPGRPDPVTLVAETGVVVAFEWAGPGAPGAADEATEVGGDQAARRIGDVVVRVNAPADLRRRVLATVHRSTEDPLGCAMRLDAAQGPGSRPEPRIDPADLGDLADLAAQDGVRSVLVCRYLLPSAGTGRSETDGLRLESSAVLAGDDAQDVVVGLAEGAPGGGPDTPGTCLPEVSYGDDFLLLHVEHDGGTSQVQVTYSGCDHNGVDDGTTVRALTSAVGRLFTGAVQLRSFSGGGGKERILLPALER